MELSLAQRKEMSQLLRELSGRIALYSYKRFMLGNMAYKCKETKEEIFKKTREQLILKYGSKKQKRPIRRKLKRLRKKLEIVLNE